MDLARDAKRSSRLNDRRVRGLLYQTLLFVCIVAVAWGATYNALINMRARGIPMGFGFWNQVAGFEINLHLISYSGLSTYGRAFWVGLLNTLLIGAICIPLATLLGFMIGVARLLAQLAALAICTRLHHPPAQHAAAPAAALLVQRRSQVPARTSPIAEHRRRRISQ